MKSWIISKQNIEKSFSRAAVTYDSHAHVQEKVNEILLFHLPSGPFRHVLEIGCGTGLLTAQVSSGLHPERYVAVDLSLSMLKMAQKHIPGKHDIYFICCDAENICLKAETKFDLLISASAMQWFHDFKISLRSLLTGHLKKDGLFVGAFFGNNTLMELRETISIAFPNRHIIIPTSLFPDFSKDLEFFSEILSSLEIYHLVLKKEYKDIYHLLRAFKMTGVVPVASDRPPLLTTRGDFSRLESTYLKRYGGIKASFEIIVVKGTR